LYRTGDETGVRYKIIFTRVGIIWVAQFNGIIHIITDCCHHVTNKELSYRRETARQMRMSRPTYKLANWSCNAQNTAESQRLYYFFHIQTLWFKKC